MLEASNLAMEYQLKQYRQERQALKFNMALHINFEQAVDPSIVTPPPAVLVNEQFEVYADTDINELLHEASKQLQNNIEAYETTGSGWVISHFVALDTIVWQLDPLQASTYHPLSTWIRNTKCVINVKNKDEKCFKYAVLAGLYEPSDPHPSRDKSYSYAEIREDATDFSMLKFPVTLGSISKFENVKNISVNV